MKTSSCTASNRVEGLIQKLDKHFSEIFGAYGEKKTGFDLSYWGLWGWAIVKQHISKLGRRDRASNEI